MLVSVHTVEWTVKGWVQGEKEGLRKGSFESMSVDKGKVQVDEVTGCRLLLLLSWLSTCFN